MSGGREITARLGDTLGAIAAREGVPFDAVWSHEKNRAVKDRGHPDLVYPGDVIFVPLPEEKWAQGQTGGEIAATLKVPPVPLKLRLHVNGVPTEGATCTPSFAPEAPKKTEQGGKLELALPAGTAKFRMHVELPPPKKKAGEEGEPPPLLAPKRDLTILVGHLVNDLAVVQARLTNVGFHADPIDGKLGPRTRGALRRFQRRVGLEANGDPGHKATLDKLREVSEGQWDGPFTDADKLVRSVSPTYHVLTGAVVNCVNVLDGPDLIIDAHMHVNSGKCSPMPLVWDKKKGMKLLKPSRSQLTKLGLPGLNVGERVLAGLEVTARQLGDMLIPLTDGISKVTEVELQLLTVAVAKALILGGWVTKRAAQATLATLDHTAGLLDTVGTGLRSASRMLHGASATAIVIEQKLRTMVPDQAYESAEVMQDATTRAGRIVAAVVNAFRRAKDGMIDAPRAVAHAVSTKAADVARLGARGLDGAGDLQAELAALTSSVAKELRDLANVLDVDAELAFQDARDLIEYVAAHLQNRIRGKAAGARAKARAFDAKVQRALGDGEKTLAALRHFAEIGDNATQDIGVMSAQGNGDAYRNVPSTGDGDRLSMMMVMPMDMDFGHIDGYEKRQIYEPFQSRLVLEITIAQVNAGGAAVTLARRPLPPGSKKPNWPASVPLSGPDVSVNARIVEQQGPFYHYSEWELDGDEQPFRKGEPPPKIKLKKTLRWLPDDEFELFEEYPKQVQDTLEAAASNPWTLLPLYHYDPRRWSEASGAPCVKRTYQTKSGPKVLESFPRSWDEPFNEYFRDPKSRKFVGIKQYTALGYRPLDPSLPNQERFYAKCVELDLPIVCHCSPAGMYTLERPYFVHTEPARQKKRGQRVTIDELREKTLRLMEKRKVDPERVAWEEFWYCERYVSPFAWHEVLKKHRSLRLCLAHFGGDTEPYTTWTDAAPVDPALLELDLERDRQRFSWDDALVKLAADYENFYIDISFFIFAGKSDRFRRMIETFPHLREKILFGTDWWMTEKDGIDYPKFVAQARKALNAIDPELWPMFSGINPARFYRLKGNADSLAAALREASPRSKRNGGNRDERIAAGLPVLQALAPGDAHAR